MTLSEASKETEVLQHSCSITSQHAELYNNNREVRSKMVDCSMFIPTRHELFADSDLDANNCDNIETTCVVMATILTFK